MKLSQFLAAWAGAIGGIVILDHKLISKFRTWLKEKL